jgi:hypothetical protein
MFAQRLGKLGCGGCSNNDTINFDARMYMHYAPLLKLRFCASGILCDAVCCVAVRQHFGHTNKLESLFWYVRLWGVALRCDFFIAWVSNFFKCLPCGKRA